jgi:single-stranded-DNA-specific exonuclease
MSNWRKEPVSIDLVRKLNESFKVDYITASLLARREIKEPRQVRFVLESDVAYLHNPFLFAEMEAFVERVLEAQQNREKVTVFGDRDVDGITSTVLLVEELESMGLDVSYVLPEGDDPYGLTIEGIKKAKASDVSLIITVDCGISNIEEVEFAQKLGIDVLVTDHHYPLDILPDSVALINPKVEESEYPFAHLAGCGVVAKVIWALRFAKTNYYQEPFILLHAALGSSVPNNETIIIEAVKIRNLVEVERIVEEIVPSAITFEQSRIIRFLDCDLPILALDVPVEQKLLEKAFGKGIEIHLGELRSRFEQVLPHVVNRSLFKLKQLSRSIRYTEKGSELDVLIALFNAYVFRMESTLSTEYEAILDLVALGTIADLMPMVDENRILVKIGMREMEKGSRRGLLALMRLQNLVGKRLTTADVGWQLTPVINSSGRLGQPSIALNMLLSKEQSLSEKYAADLMDLNRQRQNQGEEAWKRLLPKAKASYSDFDNKFLIVEDSEVGRGLTGVMASRLLRQFNVPSMVIARIDDQRITGSVRSPNQINILDFLANFSDLFLDYGGHRCAGGFSMEKKHLETLRERMAKSIETLEELEYLEEDQDIAIDAELTADYMKPELISLVEVFEPYGEGNPPLNFMIQGARLEEIQFLSQNKSDEKLHVKLQIRFGEYRWPALFWNGSDFVLDNFKTGDDVDLIFKLGRNYFRNNESLQLTVVALRKHKTSIDKIMRLSST